MRRSDQVTHRLRGLLLHSGQHVGVGVGRPANLASSLAFAHAGAPLWKLP